jgi:hypothetical protein
VTEGVQGTATLTLPKRFDVRLALWYSLGPVSRTPNSTFGDHVMSALLFEPAPLESASNGIGTDACQLLFDFGPVSGGESVEIDREAPVVASSAGSAEPALGCSVPCKSLAKSGDSAAEEVFSSVGRRRSLGQPVRIGTVMLKLLKSYGITDEEIQAGLADFASRQSSDGQVLANAS